jgi:flagellar biosynthesis/type III secretory pathway protein FliH
MAKNLDVPLIVVKQELERRKQILLKMVEKNLRDFKSVHKALSTSLNVTDLDKEPLKEQ